MELGKIWSLFLDMNVYDQYDFFGLLLFITTLTVFGIAVWMCIKGGVSIVLWLSK